MTVSPMVTSTDEHRENKAVLVQESKNSVEDDGTNLRYERDVK